MRAEYHLPVPGPGDGGGGAALRPAVQLHPAAEALQLRLGRAGEHWGGGARGGGGGGGRHQGHARYCQTWTFKMFICSFSLRDISEIIK